MARSLARNTQLFVSTLDVNTDADLITACNGGDTFELKVLDGYSFSQDVATQEVGVNESESSCAGSGLARGTLSFNTALNPVDVSFSTYVRPYTSTIDIAGATGGGNWADCVERVLWASAMGDKTSWDTVIDEGILPGTAAPGTAEVIISQDASSIKYGLGASNTNSLMDLTLFFVLEQTTYKILDFNISTAEVDFSIDGIATINWTGQGSRVIEDEPSHNYIKSASWVAGTNYLAVPTTTTTTFLRNKLGVLEMRDNEAGAFNYATQTATETGLVIESAPPVSGVVDLTTMTGADDDYIGGIIYNSTKDQWAFISDNETTTDTVTVSNVYDTMVAGWEDLDTCNLYTSAQVGIGDVSTFTYVTATGVMTLVTATATLDDAYNGGRALNLVTGEWASIIDFETTGDTATIASADRALVALWTASSDEVAFFTAAQNAGVTYCIPITGGTLTLENNMTYLTPEELAIVNLPLAGFAGTRAISGSFTAYLNTGAQGSGGLLQDMLGRIQTSVSNNYHLKFLMGGSTGRRVEFDVEHANISVPTTNVEDLITTEISFSAKPWDNTNNEASFEDTNELVIEYFD